MCSRILALIVFATVLGVALLSLRQRQIDLTSEIVAMRMGMQEGRYGIWQRRASIARRTTPTTLAEAVARTGLALGPIAEASAMAAPPLVVTGDMTVADGDPSIGP